MIRSSDASRVPVRLGGDGEDGAHRADTAAATGALRGGAICCRHDVNCTCCESDMVMSHMM